MSAMKLDPAIAKTGQNFKYDLTTSGAISAQDTSAVKARSGLVIP